MTRDARLRGLAVAFAAHVALTAMLFADVLFAGRVPYFRDVAYHFHPSEAFAADALRQGVWPLWAPMDAGAPFLMAYPVQLVLLLALGARATLVLMPALHVCLAMCGLTVLARELGAGARGAWFAGAVFGLSGVTQSLLNLGPLSHAAAWAPWLAAALLRTWKAPGARHTAVLAALAALQASTLAVEIALQTLLAACVLVPSRPRAPQLRAVGAAAAIALLLSAPAWAGALALVEGSVRGTGFDSAVVLSWSAHPVTLAGLVWPSFLGDPHTMTDAGFWGQRFFPDGYPYLISLYMGPTVLAFAACAGRKAWRLWALAAAGITAALGAHGPLAALWPLVSHLRVPAKALFLTTLAVSLLAGLGLEAALARRRRTAIAAIGLPAVALLVVGMAVALRPDAAGRAAGRVWSSLGTAEAQHVVRRIWPAALVPTGLLGVAAAAGLLLRPPRLAVVPALCVVADLLVNNGAVEASAPADFYRLKPEVAALVQGGRSASPDARWFSFALGNTAGLHWAPGLLARNRDVWLYYMDRQVLWARTKLLDGLEGALDEDRTGFAPAGATLSPAESKPERYREIHQRLRRAGVRFVLSFAPLPGDLLAERGAARVPEIAEPLRLYELPDALPRAFWVADCEVAADEAAIAARLADASFDPSRTALLGRPAAGRPCGAGSAGGRGSVRWARVDAHTVRLDAAGDPGFAVVLEGHHRSWVAYDGAERVDLVRTHDRYWAVPLRGGTRSLLVRFQPRWRWPALGACALGSVVVAVLLAGRRLRLTQAPATC